MAIGSSGSIDLQNGSYFTTKRLNAFLLVTSDFLCDLFNVLVSPMLIVIRIII